ncbi:MAG: hypothetical protein PHS12_04680 [Candidatus Omnitrophica bacterium]|nr:hypothetical protein [Candidatus Omnitrophota bacterium]
MNYLIFDNDIYYDIDGKTGVAVRNEAQAIFRVAPMEVSVAVIETLQKQVAAPEKAPYRKEEAIASAFSGEYLVQSERIAENLFQAVAVEKRKINEVYKYLGVENVRLVVPYAAALREFLRNNNISGEKARIIFLDHLGNQVLLTIFNKEAFTTPRPLSTVLRQITRELLRSRENYRAQNKLGAETGFQIVTNSKEIVDEIVSNGLEAKENIIFLQDTYPALTGLKQGRFSMHYMLPEQFIRLRRIKEARKRVSCFLVMLSVLAAAVVMFLGTLGLNKSASARLKNLQIEEASCDEVLKRVYREKYQDILRHGKKVNFPYLMGVFIESMPSGYTLESAVIQCYPGGRYSFEAIVFLEAKSEPFAGMRLNAAFRRARIENILLKDNPGLRVALDII